MQMTSWATSIDCEFSPASPSTSASSRRRRVAARAESDERIFAPSSAASDSAAERSRSSSTPISLPSWPSAAHGVVPNSRALRERLPDPDQRPVLADRRRGEQRLGQPATAGEVHGDQVEEDADDPAELAAALLGLAAQREVGQEEAEQRRARSPRAPGSAAGSGDAGERAAPTRRPARAAAGRARTRPWRPGTSRPSGSSSRGRCRTRPSRQPRSAASVSNRSPRRRIPESTKRCRCTSRSVTVRVVIDRVPWSMR